MSIARSQALDRRSGKLHNLTSTPENTVWGGFPIDLPPAPTINSGDKVRVDASGSG